MNGVRAAHAAGMMPVMVPDMLQPTREIAALCVRVVADLHEVRAIIGLNAAGTPE
jgi:beta-phosphoglucomutase-like phosphatase (HAD superfamily)